MAPIDLGPIPDAEYPDGSQQGSFDASGNVYEKQELLHRPHAFALMHGTGGAKVAFGQLQWRIDTFTLQFKQKTVAVTAHPDHTHEPHNDHKHSQAPHTHPITMDEHSGHTGTTGIGTTTGGGGSYQHDHGGNTQSNTTDHTSGVKSTSSSNTSSVTAEDGVLEHSGVKDVSDGTSSAPAGVLNHTVTGLEGAGNVITYCDGASQDPISNINVQIPKVDAEDGPAMEATVHGQGQDDPYHQLSSYGDVYLVWVVNLENAGTEVEKCWVQVGEPTGDQIENISMGTATTNRRTATDPSAGTGLGEGEGKGVFKMKLGTVNEGSQIVQNITSDVVWTTTVMDRLFA